jgi:hypothetical protein
MKMLNGLVSQKTNSWILTLSRNWPKPFFTLFIYYVFDDLKLTFIISKLLSYVVIISVLFALADVKNDIRVVGLAISGIVMAHAILIYQQHRFEQVYLSIKRNLPYKKSSLFLFYILSYLVLLIPESIWLLITFNLSESVGLIALMLSIAMLFHCILYKIGLAMNKYLPCVLGLFLLIFLLILFGLTWWLILVCSPLSFMIFQFSYYNPKLTI